MNPAAVLTIIQIAVQLVTLIKGGVDLGQELQGILGKVQPHLPVIAASNPAEHQQARDIIAQYLPGSAEDPQTQLAPNDPLSFA